MSRPPKQLTAMATAASTCDSTRTSSATASDWPPASSTSCAAVKIVPGNFGCGSVVFPQTTMLAPSAAARMAIAWPMPRVAPVIKTVRPLKDIRAQFNRGYTDAPMGARNVIADLRELAQLTSNADGAQRLAWGPVWRQARQWFNGKLAELGITPELDAAGNSWATRRGDSDRTVIIGSHLDSVPNGGWLDGALGMMAGLEALRMFKDQRPPVTLRSEE